jgi:hypothetical protein
VSSSSVIVAEHRRLGDTGSDHGDPQTLCRVLDLAATMPRPAIGVTIVEPGGARTEFRCGSTQIVDLMPDYEPPPPAADGARLAGPAEHLTALRRRLADFETASGSAYFARANPTEVQFGLLSARHQTAAGKPVLLPRRSRPVSSRTAQ